MAKALLKPVQEGGMEEVKKLDKETLAMLLWSPAVISETEIHLAICWNIITQSCEDMYRASKKTSLQNYMVHIYGVKYIQVFNSWPTLASRQYPNRGKILHLSSILSTDTIYWRLTNVLQFQLSRNWPGPGLAGNFVKYWTREGSCIFGEVEYTCVRSTQFYSWDIRLIILDPG